MLFHVAPMNDLHVTSFGCWCVPRIQRQDDPAFMTDVEIIEAVAFGEHLLCVHHNAAVAVSYKGGPAFDILPPVEWGLYDPTDVGPGARGSK